MKTLKVFKPCSEGRHEKCAKETASAQCICPCRHKKVVTQATKLAQAKTLIGEGKPHIVGERNPHYRSCHFFLRPSTANPGCKCRRLDRISYAGIAPSSGKRQQIEAVCNDCGNVTNIYPAESLFPEEVENLTTKYRCNECVPRDGSKARTLEYIDEDVPVCENCGGEHDTDQCSE